MTCPRRNVKQRWPLAGVGVSACRAGQPPIRPTVLMTAVPAQVAGVAQLAGGRARRRPSGAFNPDLLATCRELDITKVIGSADPGRRAALAYGVEGFRA